MIKRSNFGVPYEPLSLSAKTTLFVKISLQKVESRRDFLFGKDIVREYKIQAYMRNDLLFRFSVVILVSLAKSRRGYRKGKQKSRGNENEF